MSLGICFGTYAPMHRGHLDLIMQSKKENDICIVVVCGYQGDRGEQYSGNLDLNCRFSLVQQVFADDENVFVIKVSDTELGLDESMSDSNWNIWIKDIYFKINKLGFKVKDVTWYVGEPDYKRSIKRTSPKECDVVLVERTLNPISATMIRNHPLKYFDNMAHPYKPYFTHCILVSGTASEGKSTLVKDIARYFDIPYAYEKGRDNYDFCTDEQFDFEHFMYNIYEQNKLIDELLKSHANKGIIISDTDNAVTLMYGSFYASRPNFALKKDDYEVLKRVANQYRQCFGWNKIFLMPPTNKTFVDDGQRYMADGDMKIRKDMYKKLISIHHFLDDEYEDYIDFTTIATELTGSYYENYLTVKKYIEELYNGQN